MSVRMRSLLTGAATFVPGVRLLSGRRTGGTSSARYCYSVWLRHLCYARQNGLPAVFETVAELGPGDSLGIGLAALLSGTTRYLALDVVRYADKSHNLLIFEELVALFRDRAPIPDELELPYVQPKLQSYRFPSDLLPNSRLDAALDPNRLAMLRASLCAPPDNCQDGSPICYIAPWTPNVIQADTVDLVISQTVLQLAPDLPSIYAEMARWLRSGGAMSHEIDFKSFGLTTEWNGHWACPDALWRVAAGRRRHMTNREPLSAHLAYLQRAGCELVATKRVIRPTTITRATLAPRFRALTDEDLTTSSALIQAIKT